MVFGVGCTNKDVLHKNGKPANIDEVDILLSGVRIVLSSKHSYCNKGSFKYFIGYIHIGNVYPVPLLIKFPQRNGCVKYFHKNNKCMSFFSLW